MHCMAGSDAFPSRCPPWPRSSDAASSPPTHDCRICKISPRCAQVQEWRAVSSDILVWETAPPAAPTSSAPRRAELRAKQRALSALKKSYNMIISVRGPAPAARANCTAELTRCRCAIGGRACAPLSGLMQLPTRQTSLMHGPRARTNARKLASGLVLQANPAAILVHGVLHITATIVVNVHYYCVCMAECV